jgi:2-amino-4-hydroxy-6-hydroxymethyldihydropteridine diphosphokinase
MRQDPKKQGHLSQVFIGVGSNIEREFHARVAVKELAKLGDGLTVSPVYECESVGFDSHPFYNFVVQLQTGLSIAQLHQALRAIEIACGRKQDAQKYQDRALDLDILLFADLVSASSPTIPRKDIYQYAFVIQPLYDLCPALIVPNDGRTIQQIWQGMDNLQALKRVDFIF